MKTQDKTKSDIRWKGILFGAIAGFLVGKGWMGAGIGALVGYNIARELQRRKISAAQFAGETFARRAAAQRNGGTGANMPSVQDPLADAYRLFGLPPSASESALRSAYRALVKKHHPDALRARGVPEEAIRATTDTMSKVNAAWSLIEKARRL